MRAESERQLSTTAIRSTPRGHWNEGTKFLEGMAAQGNSARLKWSGRKRRLSALSPARQKRENESLLRYCLVNALAGEVDLNGAAEAAEELRRRFQAE